MPSHTVFRRVFVAASMLAGITTSLQGQLITPKTVPIHQGEQFGIYPSQWPSMGGVSIALVDTIGDPWGNPAKAMRLTSGSIQVMPFTHVVPDSGVRRHQIRQIVGLNHRAQRQSRRRRGQNPQASQPRPLSFRPRRELETVQLNVAGHAQMR